MVKQKLQKQVKHTTVLLYVGCSVQSSDERMNLDELFPRKKAEKIPRTPVLKLLAFN